MTTFSTRAIIARRLSENPHNLPRCPHHNTLMGRFAWYQTPDEPWEWWLCYDCNREMPLEDRSCIHVLPKR